MSHKTNKSSKETHNNVDIKALSTFTNEFNVVYRDAPNDPQKIQLNTLSKTEIFIQNGTVAVFDFLKNIGGFYSAKYNRCFLVGGLDDERIKSPDDLKKELDSMKVRLHGGNQELGPSAKQISYRGSRVAVTDQSFLPEALAPFCKGRPTYWLTPETGHQAKRVKRESSGHIHAEFRIFGADVVIDIEWGKKIKRSLRKKKKAEAKAEKEKEK
ncbi:hypothetical protein LSAT2_002403 [Lamellibrachia satsuma]|nr:hypothetical protein LSAT2_002403 [Lamellibrachia satsuma]